MKKRMGDERVLLEEKYRGDVDAPEFVTDCARLAYGEPLAYVIGWTPFLGLRINLDSRPLIPRPETEWWTEQMRTKITSIYGSNFRGSILDLCAGSGAIGCAVLKTLSYMKVFFGEVEPRHEATIWKNIRDNGLDETRAEVRIGDLFAPFENKRFDFIAVNPPYVPEARVLPASVTDYEPALALRAGVDGLSVIRRIAAETKNHLLPGGELWMECDMEHADEAYRLVRVGGARSAEVRTDHYGRPRLIVGYY